jgi:hypothetical protein
MERLELSWVSPPPVRLAYAALCQSAYGPSKWFSVRAPYYHALRSNCCRRKAPTSSSAC